jgi:hypothetical protein
MDTGTDLFTTEVLRFVEELTPTGRRSGAGW